jgi:hypothetical protein
MPKWTNRMVRGYRWGWPWLALTAASEASTTQAITPTISRGMPTSTTRP